MILKLLGNVSVVLAPLVRQVRLKNVEPQCFGASMMVTFLADMKLTVPCSSCGQLWPLCMRMLWNSPGPAWCLTLCVNSGQSVFDGTCRPLLSIY